jgi:flagellar motility protein MotE (MotC chaperone)
MLRGTLSWKDRGTAGLAVAAAALLLSGSGPAPAESPKAAPAEAPRIVMEPQVAAQPEAPKSEIERFCGNIADAAKDRRYALQAQELQELQAELDKRIAALEAKRAEYESWLKRREEFLSKAEDNLVSIYGKMKPDGAAERLAEVDVELAAGILMKLDSRKAGVILNEMERKAAATLTGIMAAATRKVDPT